MQLMKMGGFLKTHYVHIQHAETKLHSPHKTSNHRHETRKQHITAFIAETHFKSVRHDTHTHIHTLLELSGQHCLFSCSFHF